MFELKISVIEFKNLESAFFKNPKVYLKKLKWLKRNVLWPILWVAKFTQPILYTKR